MSIGWIVIKTNEAINCSQKIEKVVVIVNEGDNDTETDNDYDIIHTIDGSTKALIPTRSTVFIIML